jgi:hypothetical protein
LGLHRLRLQAKHEPENQEQNFDHIEGFAPLTLGPRESPQMAEPVKSKLIATRPCNTKRPKRPETLRPKRRRSSPLRLLPIFILVVVSVLAGQGCASQGQETRVARQAAAQPATTSEEDAQCRTQGPPGSPAYVGCRKALAEQRTQRAIIQEQKRRDFDRVLGNGTGGFDENF